MAAKAGTKTKTKTKSKPAGKAKTATRPRAKTKLVRKERRIASATAPIVLEFRDGRRTPIWKACSTDDSRPVLCHPFLIRTGQPSKRRFFLCATDSYQAVKVPVIVTNPAGDAYDDVDDSLLGPVPVAAVKAWTKPEKKGTVVALKLTPKDATVQMFGADAFRQSWDRPDGAPIDLAKLIAGYLEGGLLEEYVVGFNPDVFAKTAAALGAGGPGFHPIIMRFCRTKDSDGPTGLRPMVLTVDRGGGKDAGKVRDLDSTAILMPIRVNR